MRAVFAAGALLLRYGIVLEAFPKSGAAGLVGVVWLALLLSLGTPPPWVHGGTIVAFVILTTGGPRIVNKDEI